MAHSPENAFIHIKHFLGQFLGVHLVRAVFQSCPDLFDPLIVCFRELTELLFELFQVLA